jgi:hypothetical protein
MHISLLQLSLFRFFLHHYDFQYLHCRRSIYILATVIGLRIQMSQTEIVRLGPKFTISNTCRI